MPHLTITNPSSKCHHRIHYEVKGNPEAEHKVLFIMGLLTDGAAWRFQADYFGDHASNDYQVVCFDNRGVGMSDCPMERITTVKLAQDALKLADHLGWSEFHVVGISMGGMISLELCQLAMHRVVSLSLLCTHAGGLTSLPILPEAAVVCAKAAVAQTKEQRIHCAMELLYGQRTLKDPVKYAELYEHHAERLARRVSPKFFGAIGQLLAIGTHYVSWGKLAKIRHAPFPKLILVGTEDKLIREINSYLLHKAVGGTFHVLDGAGHGFLVEVPDEVNETLEKVFQRGTAERKRLYTASKLLKAADSTDEVDLSGKTGGGDVAMSDYSESQSLIDLAKISVGMVKSSHASAVTALMSSYWDKVCTRFPLP